MSEADPAFGARPGWWRRLARGVDHGDVLGRVLEDAGLSGHYLFMTVMSAGIAILGLLLSSPAVVIGAMLISPLMGPIVGFGFGIALFDLAAIRRSLIALAIGIAVAVSFTALVVAISPLQTVTSEIAARTRPNLFDLGVAILSGLAATYAMVRGRHGAIVGVAIAVAVMPPLAVVGFGVATGNISILAGAAFLFFTNLMAIGLSAAALARVYGFGHTLSPKQSWLQAVLILGIFAALALPLGLALRQIAWEAVAARQARDVLGEQFADEARIAQVALDFDAEPLRVTATVFTPAYRTGAEGAAGKELTRMFGRPVAVALEQVRVGGEGAEAAQLASARSGVTDAGIDRLAEELALIAGAPREQVLIDRDRRTARVRAAVLPGATLAAYRMLEGRLAAAERGWTILLVPPLLPLPGAGEVDVIAWAAARLERPVAVAGEGAEALATALRERGVTVEVASERGELAVEWAEALSESDAP